LLEAEAVVAVEFMERLVALAVVEQEHLQTPLVEPQIREAAVVVFMPLIQRVLEVLE
jgi:hypothetical protein